MGRNQAYICPIDEKRRKPMLQIFAQALLLTVQRPGVIGPQTAKRRG